MSAHFESLPSSIFFQTPLHLISFLVKLIMRLLVPMKLLSALLFLVPVFQLALARPGLGNLHLDQGYTLHKPTSLRIMRKMQYLLKPDFYTERWHSRPGEGDNTARLAGSRLPDCSHACGSCSPCRRVMVSFVCSTYEEAETCPMAYRCTCNSRSYPVP